MQRLVDVTPAPGRRVEGRVSGTPTTQAAADVEIPRREDRIARDAVGASYADAEFIRARERDRAEPRSLQTRAVQHRAGARARPAHRAGARVPEPGQDRTFTRRLIASGKVIGGAARDDGRDLRGRRNARRGRRSGIGLRNGIIDRRARGLVLTKLLRAAARTQDQHPKQN